MNNNNSRYSFGSTRGNNTMPPTVVGSFFNQNNSITPSITSVSATPVSNRRRPQAGSPGSPRRSPNRPSGLSYSEMVRRGMIVPETPITPRPTNSKKSNNTIVGKSVKSKKRKRNNT